jgi:hypothetical protein
MKPILLLSCWCSLIPLSAMAAQTSSPLTDASTPLHLLEPSYPVPYGKLTPEQVKATTDRILVYLTRTTPFQLEDRQTHRAC